MTRESLNKLLMLERQKKTLVNLLCMVTTFTDRDRAKEELEQIKDQIKALNN